MSSKADQMNKLHALEAVETNLAKALEYAGLTLNELAKDNPKGKNVETNTKQFVSCLESIESELLIQINYLTTISTGQPHEGSCYGAQKDLSMAQLRLEHVKNRLSELDKLRPDSRLQPPSTASSTATGAAQRSIKFQDMH